MKDTKGPIAMKHFRVVAIGLLALVGVGAAAQNGQAQAAAVQVPAAPKGSPQIEKLLRGFEGAWPIKEEFAPDASSPNGATGEGRIVWRAGRERFRGSRSIGRSGAARR